MFDRRENRRSGARPQIAHIEEEEKEEIVTKRTTFMFDDLDRALQAVTEGYQHWADRSTVCTTS
jgi:hypothetical protein